MPLYHDSISREWPCDVFEEYRRERKYIYGIIALILARPFHVVALAMVPGIVRPFLALDVAGFPSAILDFLIGNWWDTQIPIVARPRNAVPSLRFLIAERDVSEARAIVGEITRVRAAEMNFPLNLNSGEIRIRGKGFTTGRQRVVSRSEPRSREEKLVDNFHGYSKLKKFPPAREEISIASCSQR